MKERKGKTMTQSQNFEKILNCEVLLDRASAIPQEVQSVLNTFKRKVETPSGVKNFFETCSEINVIVQDDTIVIFDIVNHDEHFMYHLGDTGNHRIGFYDRGLVVVDQFNEDEYFCRFLKMLSEAIGCKYLQGRG